MEGEPARTEGKCNRQPNGIYKTIFLVFLSAFVESQTRFSLGIVPSRSVRIARVPSPWEPGERCASPLPIDFEISLESTTFRCFLRRSRDWSGKSRRFHLIYIFFFFFLEERRKTSRLLGFIWNGATVI